MMFPVQSRARHYGFVADRRELPEHLADVVIAVLTGMRNPVRAISFG
jgi:hypothetical protein